MRHGNSTRQTALAALLAGLLSSGIAAADAADGTSSAKAAGGSGSPIRMKLEVNDGKTCPPPNARTEVRFRLRGELPAGSLAASQPQGETCSLLSYCPASAEPRSVVHSASYVGEETPEARPLTATIQRTVWVAPVRGKLAPPRSTAKQATSHLFADER
jgi:hypothetical protein